LIQEIVDYSPATKIPKASVAIEIKEAMSGRAIARMLERRLGKNIEFKKFRTAIIDAVPGADAEITSRGQKIEPSLLYRTVWIDISAAYGHAIDAATLAKMISQIADCPW